jgi:hypothetical protein
MTSQLEFSLMAASQLEFWVFGYLVEYRNLEWSKQNKTNKLVAPDLFSLTFNL